MLKEITTILFAYIHNNYYIPLYESNLFTIMFTCLNKIFKK